MRPVGRSPEISHFSPPPRKSRKPRKDNKSGHATHQIDQGTEEAGLDDGRLVLRVDRDVADARGGREDEGQEGRLEEAQEGGEAVVLDDLDLVAFCGRRRTSQQKGEPT